MIHLKMMAKKALRLSRKIQIPFIGTLVVTLVLLVGLVFSLQAVQQRTSDQGEAASKDFQNLPVPRAPNGGFENWGGNGLPTNWELAGAGAQLEKSTDGYQGQFAVKLVRNRNVAVSGFRYLVHDYLSLFPGKYVLELHYKSLGSHPGGGIVLWQWRGKNESPVGSGPWREDGPEAKGGTGGVWKFITQASFGDSSTYTILTTQAFEISPLEIRPYDGDKKTGYSYQIYLWIGDEPEATPILVDSIVFKRVP